MENQKRTPTEKNFYLPDDVLPQLCQETIIENGYHKVELEVAILQNSALAGVIYRVGRHESDRLKALATGRLNAVSKQLRRQLASGKITQEQYDKEIFIKTQECPNADIAYCCPLVTGNLNFVESALFNAEFKYLRNDEVETGSIFYFGCTLKHTHKESLADPVRKLAPSEVLEFSRDPENIEGLSSKERYELLFNLMQGMDFIGTVSVETLSKALAESITIRTHG